MWLFFERVQSNRRLQTKTALSHLWQDLLSLIEIKFFLTDSSARSLVTYRAHLLLLPHSPRYSRNILVLWHCPKINDVRIS